MKQLILIVPALILQNVLNFAQEPLFGSEMRLKVINASPSTADHTFNLIKLSKTYCYELESSSISDCDECPNPNCFSCNGGSYLVTIDESGKYPPNGNPSNEGGAFCKQEGAYLDAVYGYGVYKYIDETTGDYVFIDFRDARYTRESIDPPYEGYHDDFFLRYDGNGYFQLDGEDSGGEGDYEITVPVGGLIQIWKGTWRIQTQNGYEYKSFTLPDVNPFPSGGEDDFWQNCLVIAAENLQPLQIIWAPNPDQSNISKYYLYREIDAGGFIKIGEFNNQTFDYKDKSILFTGDGSSTVSYKVTSFNGIEST